MADTLFDRRVKLTIGQEPPTGDFVRTMPTALVITGLRVQFRIEKSLKAEPQKAAIAVWNLSDKSRGQLVGKGLRVVLEAGYPDSLAVIYQGHTRTIDHPKEGVDWPSKIECGTGERAMKYAQISESARAGSPVGDAIKAAVNALVADPGNALTKAGEIVESFSSSYAASGRASDELTRLLEPRGLSWAIVDDRMLILGEKETLPEQPITLSPDTGLVGSPELGTPPKKGGQALVKMKSLLQPQFRPGGRVLLQSRSRTGTFKIINMAHVGDTSGGEWYTEIEGLPVS